MLAFRKSFPVMLSDMEHTVEDRVTQTQTAHHHHLQTVNGTMMLKTMLTRLTRINFKSKKTKVQQWKEAGALTFTPGF